MLRLAIHDPAMQGTPLDVFLRCFLWLDDQQFRALDGRRVANAARMNVQTARRTLSLICELGYLDRGPRWRHGTQTYRIRSQKYL
jgi:hypothetical protein